MSIAAASRRSSRLPALLLAVAALTGAACEPDSTADPRLEAATAATFSYVGEEAMSVDAGDVVRLRFDATLDAKSVGPRSVRLLGRTGRSGDAVELRCVGEELWIATASLPPGEVTVVQVAGAPSPRALRSSDGSALESEVRVALDVREGSARDLSGPVLLKTHPAGGATDVRVGTTISLTFDEPLARGSVRAGDAVVLLVDGRPVRSRQRLSHGGSTLAVRSARPLPPGSRVEVRLTEALLDRAGNPVDAGSVLEFWTQSDALHELTEPFLTSEMLDPSATTSDWASRSNAGGLVAATRRLALGASDGEPQERDAATVSGGARVQLLLPAVDLPAGYASGLALRVRGLGVDDEVTVRSLRVGLTDLQRLERSFDANLRATQVQYAREEGVTTRAGSSVEDGVVELPFELPVPTVGGMGLLVDVELELPAGVELETVASVGDVSLDDDGIAGRSPDVALYLTTGTPIARSRWYDSGFGRPDWREAQVEMAVGDVGQVRFEYQAAPARADGAADALFASDWELSPADLPRYRFIRFRVRFEAFDDRGHPAVVERVSLPFTVR